MSYSGLKGGLGSLNLIVKVQCNSSVDLMETMVETMLWAVISVWNLRQSESMHRSNVNKGDKKTTLKLSGIELHKQVLAIFIIQMIKFTIPQPNSDDVGDVCPDVFDLSLQTPFKSRNINSRPFFGVKHTSTMVKQV